MHKRMPLSEGVVLADGVLERPYHGFCYDGRATACASRRSSIFDPVARQAAALPDRRADWLGVGGAGRSGAEPQRGAAAHARARRRRMDDACSTRLVEEQLNGVQTVKTVGQVETTA